MHRQRYMQGFALLASAGLASILAVALERVSPVAGLAVAAVLLAGAGYAYLLLHALPARLLEVSGRAVLGIDKLMDEEGNS